MEKIHSRLTCTGTKVTLEDGKEFLIVEFVIDCPVCGQQRIRIAGHHLRAVRDAIIEQLDIHADPKLTGEDAGVQVLERLVGLTNRGGDPTQN